MPYFDVDVYLSDEELLEKLSDNDLERELARRRGKGFGPFDKTHPWTPDGMADDLRSAFYARDASRFESLVMRLDTLTQQPRRRACSRPPIATPGKAEH